ncbi:MAG TPA: SagB/ThcOx family dehydrogenase [Gemmatimonadales bacterium]
MKMWPVAGPAVAEHPTLEDTLSRRRSVRLFSDRALSEDEVLKLCWAAQGVTDPKGHRTAPSAGARYPLELYVATPDGCYAYDPPHHRLLRRTEDDLRAALQWAALSQEAVGQSPAVFVVAAQPARTTAEYGHRGRRYVHLEAGHAAQNLLLEATAMGFGAVPIGAFDDARLREVLDLPADREVVYLIPIGEPAP